MTETSPFFAKNTKEIVKPEIYREGCGTSEKWTLVNLLSKWTLDKV